MPYLHWATSGKLLESRSKLMDALSDHIKNRNYERPSGTEIGKLDIPDKMKLMAMFLYPINDRCLHVRRTLDQFYYSTLPEADSRTTDQVVYKFAMKQSQKQEEKDKLRKEKDEETRQKMTQGSIRSYKGGMSNSSGSETSERTRGNGAQIENPEPLWDPPKVLMVNQLWLWVINGGRSNI
jgi:hypothetical protein